MINNKKLKIGDSLPIPDFKGASHDEKTYQIQGMECPMCALKLEGLEDDLPGVKCASASYHRQRLEVEFDEKCLSEAQLLAAIKTLGYTAQST